MDQQSEGKKRLAGKVAIITGATGGIGEATAKLFLSEGASVMLVARSAEKLKATCERLGANARLAKFVADATDEAATAAAVDETMKSFGGVDILLANAGTEGSIKPLDAHTFADFEAVLRTNVLGVWLAMKYCVAPMKQRGGGSMIAISSIAGVTGSPGLAPYNASKHAVLGLVRSAAVELPWLSTSTRSCSSSTAARWPTCSWARRYAPTPAWVRSSSGSTTTKRVTS